MPHNLFTQVWLGFVRGIENDIVLKLCGVQWLPTKLNSVQGSNLNPLLSSRNILWTLLAHGEATVGEQHLLSVSKGCLFLKQKLEWFRWQAKKEENLTQPSWMEFPAATFFLQKICFNYVILQCLEWAYTAIVLDTQ